MEGSNIDYDLNITGFGDTWGIIRDKAIVDQIREFYTTRLLDSSSTRSSRKIRKLSWPIFQNIFPNEAASDFPGEANKAELLILYNESIEYN
jgi:hypothetical protein